MAGFSYRKNLDGSAYNPINMEVIGKNSVTFSRGDIIRINTSGFADIATGGEGIAGVCVSVVDSNGKALDTDSGTNDTWTLDSDNQTDEKYKVVFIPALPNYLFYNDADASLAQTNLFQYFDTNDENDVDVATATDTATAQVRLIEIDPDDDGDASKGLFQIVESQFAPIAINTAA